MFSFIGHPTFKRAMRLLFWLALIFAVTMAWLPKPPGLPFHQIGDKTAHMLAFATLAGLGVLGFPFALRWRVAERLSFLGAMVEVVQAIPALKRTCDIRDWLADTAAIMVVMALASLIIPRIAPGTDQAG